MNFALKQSINRFKKLSRKFKTEYNQTILNELIELDRYIAENNIKWVKTYGK